MAPILALALLVLSPASNTAAQHDTGPPAGTPLAVVDLATPDGVALVQGTWRYSDTRIVEVEFRSPGPDGQPTGTPGRTYDYTPHAGDAGFDDSTWEVIAPTSLGQRRGGGRIAFNWYRLRLTIPERVGEVDPRGSTVVFDTSLDDYAEVWVDGELPRAIGQVGESVVAGWNASNRLVVGRDVRPGQQIQLAVFGINGPLSNPPTNFIWIRHARLEFHAGPRGPRAITPREVNVEVERVDPGLDAVVGPNPKLWKLAEGFASTEAPVWVDGSGELRFSDRERNVSYGYTKDGELHVVRQPSGFSATSAPRGEPIDDVEVDEAGRLYVSSPGGLRIVSSHGTHLGTIRAPQHIHDTAWGDDDGKTLYLCAGRSLYRMRLNVAGVRP